MTNALDLSPAEWGETLKSMGQPAFRAGQVFSWLHKGARFADMGNLPKSLREALAAEFDDAGVTIFERFPSKLDGTIKYLYRLADGNLIEGVRMRYHYGDTLCVSTQVGCRMGCTFCASTLEGCVRSLTAGEMLGEVLCANRYIVEHALPVEDGQSPRVHNLVLMGSGEPLDNYDNVMKFFRLLREPDGIQIGLRNVSLSTCGIVPKMYALAEEDLPVTLSVSLHAPNDDIRRQTMPIAKVYPMEDVLSACRNYIAKTGRRVIFEYALVGGVNCEERHAVELASRLRGMQCHVNLIPLNVVEERHLKGVTEDTVRRFMSTLESLHISVTRRREMGDDIEGACGQLRRKTIIE